MKHPTIPCPGLTFAAAALLLFSGHTPANEAAWQALQRGGQVVLMRHTSTEQGPGTGNSLLRDPDCAMERNLSPRGKREAERIGQNFRSHAITVDEVWTSPYCRTVDTANIAFGQGKAAEFLSLSEPLAPAEADRNTTEAMKQIGGYTGKLNRVMVTHEPNIAAISFELLAPGAFLVLMPKGGSDFDVVGKVELEDTP